MISIEDPIVILQELKNDITKTDIHITALNIDYYYWPMRKDGNPYSRYSLSKSPGAIRAKGNWDREAVKPNNCS